MQHGSATIEVIAEEVGVCRRPLLRRVTDRATGETTIVPIPCNSTMESVCPSCADRARRLRMHQCGEGWHLAEDPPRQTPAARSGAVQCLPVDPETARWEEDGGASGPKRRGRRVRSTRRLEGFPDLPTAEPEDTTLGATFTDPKTGQEWRPSMFLTLTLDSYGRIQPGTGVPVDPKSYDYRRAALDALYFPRLVDRFWQNLRRVTGRRVQYFAAVEAQRRLSPHLHAAVRGAIPRRLIKQVVAATYAALWWPAIDTVRYSGERLPVWNPRFRRYLDPDTGRPLPTWEQALDRLADDAEPMHVLTFGRQVDIKGIVAENAEQTSAAVSYLCKYLTKSVAETYTNQTDPDPAYEAHIDRLHAEVQWLPCSETCANWLRFGVNPKDPEPGMQPGRCPSKAHDRECLGLGGRRVLVSRHWTGKTLEQHKADRGAVVRAVLEEAGIEPPEVRRLAADVLHHDGQPRFIWEDIPAAERDYHTAIAALITQRQAWRSQYDEAKRVLDNGPPDPGSPPVDSKSAITQPAAHPAA